MYCHFHELPLGEAAERSEAEEGCDWQLFYAHSAANPYSIPFCPGYLNESLHPAALFRPGKPGHLPPREGLGGGLSWIPFNRGYTEQRCASGRMISSPTVVERFGRYHSNIIVTAAKTSPSGSGKLLDRYHPKGVSEKPGGSGHGLDSFILKLVTKNLPVSTARTNRAGQGTGWIRSF